MPTLPTEIMNYLIRLTLTILAAGWLLIACASTNKDQPLQKPVNITTELQEVTVMHRGEAVVIKRLQDPTHKLGDEYTLSSRPCPPRCIHPFSLGAGVETIGELELLDYLVAASEPNPAVLVIDSRTEDWTSKGIIPGSRIITWQTLKTDTSDPLTVMSLLEDDFNVDTSEALWDFSEAKTLVLLCNGIWCNQSPQNIKTLLKLGYPAGKIKWYRGGVQSWVQLGLPLVQP
ncbi:MAG: rhodanese-like domain-containing protein [Proteobacteria bacterium]|nr:rhodanese-like domain-containing protein [Pseudomonadota bacterium]